MSCTNLSIAEQKVNRDEHLHLAEIIKNVHSQLRNEIRNGASADDVWRSHCKDTDKLRSYAAAMKRLATVHWEQNNSFTRINWCYQHIKDYFFDKGLELILDKERLNALHHGRIPCLHQSATPIVDESRRKIVLLDVGSCYHPFKVFNDLEAVAVDLHPANLDVHSCDFLEVEVIPMSTWVPGPTTEKLTALPRNFFDVIVFSLLLEYLPTPRHRWHCCLKAKDLLTTNGLLLIITPDSKHQNHNALMIKSWRISLEHIGFRRLNYTKLTHLHCIAFRKMDDCCLGKTTNVLLPNCSSLFCRNIQLPKHRSLIEKVFHPKCEINAEAVLKDCDGEKCLFNNETLPHLMYIPQDYNSFGASAHGSEQKVKRSSSEDALIKDQFGELPIIDLS